MSLVTMAMFPGQGSQYVGMGKFLDNNFQSAKLIFEQASDILSLNIKKLCFDGPEEELKLTYNTQPCILTVSFATWQVLCQETGFVAQIFAGHSLGEYSALVAANVMNFGDALKLVRRRGECMQEAVGIGQGAMAAVLNMSVADLRLLCDEISTSDNIVEIVNYNSPQQVVIAGHKGAVDIVTSRLQELSVKVIPLRVSAPFHSSLMKKVKLKLKPLLESTVLSEPLGIIIPNLTGEPCTVYDINYLIEQIDHPVLWTQTIEASQKLGTNLYVEVGPGRVLIGLIKRVVNKQSMLISTDNILEAIKHIQNLR